MPIEIAEKLRTPQVTSVAAPEEVNGEVRKVIKFDLLMQQLEAVQKEVAELKEVQVRILPLIFQGNTFS